MPPGCRSSRKRWRRRERTCLLLREPPASASYRMLPRPFRSSASAKISWVRGSPRAWGNVTGVSILATELDAKRLEVLRAALPTARQIGLISDPGNPLSAERWHLIEKAAQALDVRLAVFDARSEEELHRT